MDNIFPLEIVEKELELKIKEWEYRGVDYSTIAKCLKTFAKIFTTDIPDTYLK